MKTQPVKPEPASAVPLDSQTHLPYQDDLSPAPGHPSTEFPYGPRNPQPYPMPGLSINGSIHDQYGMGIQPVETPQGYNAPFAIQLMQPTPYRTQDNFVHSARPKQVRATQACNNCRSRKQKCDEQRPTCSACKEAGTSCEYRDVPLPKQERSMVELTNSVQQMTEALYTMQYDIAGIVKHLAMERSGPLPLPDEPCRSTSPTTADFEDIQDTTLPTNPTTGAYILVEWGPISTGELDKLRCLVEAQNIDDSFHNGQENFRGTGLPASPSSKSEPFVLFEIHGGELNTERTVNLDLDHHGTMEVDSCTVQRLCQRFLEFVQKQYLLLDESRLREMAKEFIKRCSTTSVTQAPSVMNTVPAPTAHGLGSAPQNRKRKLSDASTSAAVGHSDNSNSNSSIQSKASPAQSINHCIMLLVLALGSICNHTGPNTRLAIDASREPLQMDTPPASSSSTVTSVSSPRDTQVDTGNLDHIPGLIYYMCASKILVSYHGQYDVAHGQARVLAGLYMRQLARVDESRYWIQDACTTCRVLIDRPVPWPSSIANLYWICYQLESDLHGESGNLIHSVLSPYEHLIGNSVKRLGPNVDFTMFYCHAQIHLQKILGHAYDTIGTTVRVDLREGIWEWLSKWKEMLPSPLQWKDDKGSTTEDVKAVSMRSKYYRAVSWLMRPFVHRALRDMRQGTNPNAEQLLRIQEACKLCIDATVCSAEASNRLLMDGRIIKDVSGTAQAQVDNLRFVMEVYRSQTSWLEDRLPQLKLRQLLDYTIRALRTSVPILSAMTNNKLVLESFQRELDNRGIERRQASAKGLLSA